jgi:predicted phage-related endonuclease
MRKIIKPPHGSLEWLQRRHRAEDGRVVFGASEAPALMGASPYTTRPELFAAKLSEPQVGKQTEAFWRGNLLEPALINGASAVLGVPFITPNLMYESGRFIISLDGVDDEDNPKIVIEAKTTTRYRIGDQEDLPAEWLWQGWAQRLVTGADVYFAILDQNQRISVILCPENPEAEKQLIETAEVFAQAVEANEPPSDFLDTPMDASTVAAIWKATPTTTEIPHEEMVWLQELVRAKEMAAEAETLKKFAEDRIALLLKNNEVGTYRGEKVVSWKEQAGRSSLDTKALREAHPDICAAFEKQGKPFRVMRTHKVAAE